MIWEFWIERHRTSGRQRSGESFRPAEAAEGRREHEARNSGELWKWRRCGNVGNPKAGFPTFPQRLGNLAKAARFPHFHSSYGSLLRLNRTTPAERTECGGKSGNPKSRIPTFPPHRWPAAQGRNPKVSTMCPVRCVYHVPVLTETHLDTFLRGNLEGQRSQECERGTQECAMPLSFFMSEHFKGLMF